MNAALPTIHVVDDDEAFRKALGRLLAASGYQVKFYESGAQFLEKPPSDGLGCILLDMRMPGLSGLDLQERLSKLDIILPVVFLTGHGDIPTSVQAIKAGADDFLTKPASKARVIEAIERALARYRLKREQRDQFNSLRALVHSLTAREREVFALVVRGKMNKQIAFELGASERTVKAHRHAVMEKLKVQSTAQAVSIAERLGLLSAPSGTNEPLDGDGDD
jgi:FixJ family two-component response regulator